MPYIACFFKVFLINIYQQFYKLIYRVLIFLFIIFPIFLLVLFIS